MEKKMKMWNISWCYYPPIYEFNNGLDSFVNCWLGFDILYVISFMLIHPWDVSEFQRDGDCSVKAASAQDMAFDMRFHAHATRNPAL